MEDDLALFTNTQFFDFDSGQNTDFQAQPVKIDVDTVTRHNSTASGDVTPAQASIGDLPNLDFISSELRPLLFRFPHSSFSLFDTSCLWLLFFRPSAASRARRCEI